MLDEMKDRYEQIKDDLEPKVDERLLECGLKELDYIEFLNDQEFTQISSIKRALQLGEVYGAYIMCNQLIDDIVCYGQLINDARDYSLIRMEEESREPDGKNHFASMFGTMLTLEELDIYHNGPRDYRDTSLEKFCDKYCTHERGTQECIGCGYYG